MKYISHSEEGTKKIGQKIASGFKGGEILALDGDLGAGKTVLTKGIAQGLGYKKIVNSPTFVLMKIYKIKHNGIKNICHIDAYRINDAEEIEDIGAGEYFGSCDSVCIIEWPERVKKILPKNTIWIKIKSPKRGEREIKI